MHGLTGGSWKRNHDQATVTEKNTPRETVGPPAASCPTTNHGHRASSRPSAAILKEDIFDGKMFLTGK